MDISEILKKNEKLSEFIDQYTQLIKANIDKIPLEKGLKDLKPLIAYIFLERIYFNSKAVYQLLNLLKSDFRYKIPTFLILRTMLSDVITFCYLVYHLEKENEDDIKSVLSDNVNYFINYLKNNNEDKMQLEEDIAFLKNRYKEILINGNFGKPKHKNQAEMAKFLKSLNGMEWIGHAYEIYSDLSKFEHVGILTIDLQNTHLSNNLDYDFKNIILTISYTFRSTVTILKVIDNSEYLLTRIDELEELLNKV